MKIFLYTDKTDAFFCFIPEELYEWLSKLVDIQGMWRLEGPIVWTPLLVRSLEASENNIVWAMDYWVDCILGSFVTYFTIDRNINYNKASLKDREVSI